MKSNLSTPNQKKEKNSQILQFVSENKICYEQQQNHKVNFAETAS